ncbi:MAG: GDP-mannose 4,6-dehydratase [Vicinamibacterales bacterium]
MAWTGRKVLVTGAGGFIASHLCERLVEHGADVTALIHYSSRSDWGNLEFLSPPHKSSLRVVAGNVEDADAMTTLLKGQDVVFHLAALIAIPYSYSAPASYIRTNVEGTYNVLAAARRNGVSRVVHTSTSETYGTALYTPIDEKHPLQAQSPYAASKIGADKIAESCWLSFGTPVSTVRPFNTYGPRQSARAVIPTIISQALNQTEVRLGALDPVRDLLFVKDTVRGFLAAAESPNTVGQVVNLGRGEGVTVGELARTILTLMGRDIPIVLAEERLRPRTSEVFTLICDNAKAKQLMEWTPHFSLEEGLLEAIAFIAANQKLYKSECYAI